MNDRRLINTSIVVLGLLVFIISSIVFGCIVILGLLLKCKEWIIFVGLIFSILSIFWIGSILKTKWLIWIVKHSNSYHLIKMIAYKNLLISDLKFLKFFELNYFVNKPEYISALKLIEESAFIDVCSVPDFIEIRYSKFKILIIPILMILGSLTILSFNKNLGLIIISIIILISLLLYVNYCLSDKSVLLIGINGITFKDEFYNMDIIKKDSLRILYGTKNSSSYLIFDYLSDKDNNIKTQKINLDFLNMSRGNIDYYLYILMNRRKATANTQ